MCVCVVFCGVFLLRGRLRARVLFRLPPHSLGPLHPLSRCSVKDISLSLLSSGVRLQALPLPGLWPLAQSLIRMGDAEVAPVLPWLQRSSWMRSRRGRRGFRAGDVHPPFLPSKAEVKTPCGCQTTLSQGSHIR